MLVVIAIIGILAAIAMPVLSNFRTSDATLAATRQLLADVEYARQLAISRRTTVYMVFVPPNFFDPNGRWKVSPQWLNTTAATNLCDKQLTGYTFVTKRSVGDQPGRESPRYLTPWRTLPEGMFIPIQKFTTLPNNFYARVPNPSAPASGTNFNLYGFNTNSVPFPTEDSPQVLMPCIEFNYSGQANADPQGYQIIPLARGSVIPARNPATKSLQFGPPSVLESPAGNGTNIYTLVRIDWLTGRARLEKQEFAP